MSEDKSKSDVAKAREEEVATETAVKKQKTEDADARGDEEAEREEADEEVVDDVADVAPVPVVMHPLSNYTFGKGDKSGARTRTFREKMIKRKALFEREGTRMSVASVLVSHHNKMPTVLLLRRRDPDSGKDVFSLPESRLRLGEDVTSGLMRCLAKRLGADTDAPGWHCVALAARWTRPQFDKDIYPYTLPHVSNPKQILSVYLMTMPPGMAFKVNQGAVVVAVPLTQLYGDKRTYGPILAQLPAQLSRFAFVES